MAARRSPAPTAVPVPIRPGPPPERNAMRTTSKVAAAAAVLLALTACSDDPAPTEDADPTATVAPEEGAPGEGTPGEGLPGEGAPGEEMPPMPEADLEGLPEVVAEVDGVEITREDFTSVYEGQFQQAAMQAQMSGEEVDQVALKQRTAEGMVDTELLLLEAAERSIAPTQDEVSAVAEEIASANDMSADEFFTALEAQGLDRESALAELTEQTALEQLFAEEAGELELSEDELRDRYDEIAEQAGPDAGLPEFEDARATLETEMRREHENAAVQSLVEQLRDSADITYHL